MATSYPQYASQMTAAAKTSFLAGDQNAYLAGILAVLVGGILVFFFFPRLDKERKLLQEYHEHDNLAAAGVEPTGQQAVTAAR